MKIRSIKLKRCRETAIAGLAALTLLTAGCDRHSAQSSSPDRPEGSLRTSPQPISQLAPASRLQPVPVPHLIPATAIPERLPEVATGRPDPFAALLMPPTVITQASQPQPSQPAIAPLPMPQLSVSAMPSVEPASRSLPAVGRPNAAPISLAQAIEVSGVVQIGSNTSIIIKVPQEHSSRYVQVGDRLANGVWVKRVEMGAEPVVVLEQDGAEVLKPIGGLGTAAIGAL